jgi:hypothetical protein
MDEPEAGRRNGPVSTARRSAPAIVSGRIIDIGGLPILFRASDPARAEAMATAIGGLPVRPGPARAEIRFGDRAPEVPSTPPDESYDRLRVWRGGGLLALSYDECISAVATAEGVELGGDGDFMEAWRYIFHFAVAHVLGLHDRFVLHAGAIQRHGDSVLVFGDSGAGKSTLVLAALDCGWRALSDDLVVVRRGHTRLEASGIGKPFRVPSDVLRPGRSESHDLLHDRRQRWLVEDHAWDNGWYPIRTSILVAHGRSRRGELGALPPREIVELVLSSFLAAPEPLLARRCLPVAAEIGRNPGWRLGHAADAVVRLAETARMLDVVESRTA